jgi:flagellar biosynthesis regulator FlaF
MIIKLKAIQIDRAVATLEYLSTRTKEVTIEGKTTMVPNPCAFSGPITWDLAENESVLREALAAHGKARRNLLQKYVAAGMDPKEPSGAFLQESNELDDSNYDVEIILIAVDDLKAEDNKIPNSYRSAIRFMVDRGSGNTAAKAA